MGFCLWLKHVWSLSSFQRHTQKENLKPFVTPKVSCSHLLMLKWLVARLLASSRIGARCQRSQPCAKRVGTFNNPCWLLEGETYLTAKASSITGTHCNLHTNTKQQGSTGEALDSGDKHTFAWEPLDLVHLFIWLLLWHSRYNLE